MTKLLQINHREALGFWLNEMGLIGEVAEIGCARGTFARTVLSQWRGCTYNMIDPWISQDKEVYRENQETQEGYDNWYRDCMLLAEQDPRVKIIKDFSLPASAKFKPYQLDMVYIDANHSYVSVMADMDAWWPKVRIGGLMGGHDYAHNTTGQSWIEVQPAVDRWAQEHGKVFYVCPCSSWFIMKQAP
jgi:Methyltransferase domain